MPNYAAEYLAELIGQSTVFGAPGASAASSALNRPVVVIQKQDTVNEQKHRELEDLVMRQALVIRALARLCIEKGLYSEAELISAVNAIDAEDGVMDGKAAKRKGPRICPSCGKNNLPRAKKCMYCLMVFAKHPDEKLS